MNKNYKLLFSKVELKPEAVLRAIEQYLATEDKPTFNGLLARLFITHKEFIRMKNQTSPKMKAVVKILEIFRQNLMADLEKKLVYQTDLPQFYDKNVALRFLQGQQAQVFYEDSEQSEQSKKDEQKNISGYSLTFNDKN